MKVNISFEEFKEFIVARCKENSACQPEFMRILSSENFEEILTVLKDNYNWCWNNSLFNAEEIKQIDNEVLIANGFYYDYNGVIDSKNTVYIYGGTIQDVRGNATIQNVWDNGLYKDYRGIKPKLYLKKNAFEIVLID